LLALAIFPGAAAAEDRDRVLIHNVQLIGRQDTSKDVQANLVIVGGRLSMVTGDDPVVLPDDVAVDAEGGFLLGDIVLGDRPSFIILDGDPREQFDVLMHTGKHTRFAMEKGEIVKNELPAVAVPASDEKQPFHLWSSYKPPPMAVPIRYYDSRKWNKFTTKPVSGLFLGALVLDRLNWLSQDDNSQEQLGDLSESEGGKIRGLRFGFVGTFNFKRPWTYTVFAATNEFDRGYDSETTDSLSFLDYRVDIPLRSNLTLSVGKQKEPISAERLTPLQFWPLQERSAVGDALLPARNLGVIVSGSVPSRWVTWSVGAFNNWIDSDESFSNTSNQLTGRVTWVPVVSADEGNLFHLGLGLRASDAKQPVRSKAKPELDQAPLFVDTGEFAADDATMFNLEAYWRNGPVLVAFEYLGSSFRSSELGDPYLDGYNFSVSWAVTGESRPYRKRTGTFDPLPVARSVHQGGWGTIETSFRYSRVDLTDGGIDGGEMDIFSLGVNWWLTRWTQLGVNYRYISLDRFGTNGKSSGLNLRLLLMLD
jgi:phosphate-selective porin OprO/OprP